jgi:NAD(P)-dependent dehydrogenase (short-subunit alcohol dehydrogenase family)
VLDFKNKVAVVTGSSRGIGRAVALALARGGCAVTINYHKNRDKANEVVNSIRQMGGKAIAVKCDVSKREEVENLFAATIDAFNKVDILVNNAGVGFVASFLETTDEIWDKNMEINLRGVFLCTQIAARYMIDRNYGKIVNISSNSGFGIAMPGDTSYAVSKAGVIQLTKSAAFELGKHNIYANCIAPGAVETDMLREEARSDEEYEKLLEGRRNASSLGITGTPEDIANAVLFFASDKSRYISGKILLVDGGRRDFL